MKNSNQLIMPRLPLNPSEIKGSFMLNGQRLHDVQAVQIEAGIDSLTRVTITMLAEVETDAILFAGGKCALCGGGDCGHAQRFPSGAVQWFCVNSGKKDV
jgi:hypothetical protein